MDAMVNGNKILIHFKPLSNSLLIWAQNYDNTRKFPVPGLRNFKLVVPRRGSGRKVARVFRARGRKRGGIKAPVQVSARLGHDSRDLPPPPSLLVFPSSAQKLLVCYLSR